MSRLALLLVCSSFGASLGWADRLALLPTATRPRTGTFRAEWRAAADEPQRIWFDHSFGENWEGGLELVGTDLTANLAYNYLFPITDLAPGISVGVQDAANRTRQGRAFFAAITFHQGNTGELNQDVPTEVTIGFWSRRKGTLYLGLSLPFCKQLRALVEQDAFDVSAGFELRPFKEGSAKFMFSEEGPALSFTLQKRF